MIDCSPERGEELAGEERGCTGCRRRRSCYLCGGIVVELEGVSADEGLHKRGAQRRRPALTPPGDSARPSVWPQRLPPLPARACLGRLRDRTHSTSLPRGPFFLLAAPSVCTNPRKPCEHQPCSGVREGNGALTLLPGGTCASCGESVSGTTAVATQVLGRSAVTEPGKACRQAWSGGCRCPL